MATTYMQDALTAKAIKELYPTDDGSTVTITDPAVLEAVENYLAMQELESEAAKAKEDAKLVIQTAMRHAAWAHVGPYKVQWEAFEKAAYTVKASVQRPVRVKKTTTPD